MLIFKVPGRLGMLVTLDLIASNIYNSVKAPIHRKISYIEIWMIVVHVPIFTAILEYGVILTMKKWRNTLISSTSQAECQNDYNLETKSKSLDCWTFVFSLMFIIIFNTCYWINAMLVLKI